MRFINGFGNAAFQFGANPHSSFETFAVQGLQSLGLTMALDEYFTFQKCPRCHDFVESVGMRVKHCGGCAVYFHRDVMAAHNMVNLLKSQCLGYGRPAYLTRPVMSGRKRPHSG